MAIRPVTFNDDGTISVVHDELHHSGTVVLADVAFARTNDGAVNVNYLYLPCPEPGCDSVSLHPIGGGAAPIEIQRLFALKIKELGSVPGAGSLVPLEVIGVDTATWDAAKAVVEVLANKMDGPGRFQIAQAEESDSIKLKVPVADGRVEV